VGYTFQPIGIVHSCFKDKFGVPRQPRLAPASRGSIELLPPFARTEAVRELEQFSHIWVLFVFHSAKRGEWKPTVRPPRLGGNRRIGVFASRSPERANPIGMSVVKLERIDASGQGVILHISNLDLIEGTPVLDIKPYVPYVDCVDDARAGYAPAAPDARLQVIYSGQAQQQLQQYATQYPELSSLIEQVLQLDPRPAYQNETDSGERLFGIRLYDLDIKWRVENDTVLVVGLDKTE